MSNKKYFRVGREWMEECGQGDEARVYLVSRIEESTASRENDIIFLLRDNGSEWAVFPQRGCFVPPYTVLIENQKFVWTTADVQVRPGYQLHVPMFYHTSDEAAAAVKLLNSHLNTVIISETKTAMVSHLKTGQRVSRLYRSGLPMKSVFTVGHAEAGGRISLVDAKGHSIWIKPDTLVAVL